jgi:ribulose-5-phosphate 4-epimerase/fuculose-1-phosphate aldolase
MADQKYHDELNELATAHRIFAYTGQDDITSGHLSWRDPDGRGFWMKRSQIGMDEVMGPDDMILIDFDGKKIGGDGQQHYEWPIHAEIMRVRPDVHSIGHTHAFHSQIFASTNEPLRPIAKEGAWFDDQPKFKETCSLINTPELGVSVARTLGSADAVFLMSHGVVFVGTTIREATMVGIYLEKAVKAQITIAMTGFEYSWPDMEDVLRKRAQTRSPRAYNLYWNYFVRHLDDKPR